MIAPEELLWQKLYILQRDRCDWPDVLNLIYALGPLLDWEHLLEPPGAGPAPPREHALALWLALPRTGAIPARVVMGAAANASGGRRRRA